MFLAHATPSARCRVIPLVRMYEKMGPELDWQLSALEVAAFTLTRCGALFAVCGLAEWVAITVAIAAAVESFIAHLNLRSQREVVNKNINTIQNMLTWWDSLTIVERRTVHCRERAVLTVEDCVVAFAETKTGINRVSDFEMDANTNQSKADKGDAGKEGEAEAGGQDGEAQKRAKTPSGLQGP